MGKLIKLLTTSCCNSKEKKRQREPQSIEDILGTDTARSSQLTTRSSADTCTLTARKENLEIAVSLLQDSSKRMVEAVNIQIEKAIEIIMSANEDENNTLPEMKNRSVLSNENSKLTQIVHLRTECSKITRNALAEHGEALAQLLLMAQPSIEVTHRHRSKLGMGGGGGGMVFNANFNNISVISWRSVLLVKETGENYRPVASHWSTNSKFIT